MKKGTYGVIGIAIFAILVVAGIWLLQPRDMMPEGTGQTEGVAGKKPGVITLTGAVGGGKENFLADEEIAQILKDEYGIVVNNVTWSNGRISDEALAADGANTYDFVFFSDQRYYEQYQTANNKTYKKEKGYIALNTPVVFYSWTAVVETLEKAGIAEKRGEVYYLTDMSKLLSYIDEQKTWREITTDTKNPIYANRNPMNIISVDPVTSSPGATYYGLLAAVMDPTNRTGTITTETLTYLQAYYKHSGFLTFTPADLFDQYLRIGMGSYPLIVDYEKSLIDWATANPEKYATVKEKIAVIYPEPTIWNSHCILSFNDNGSILVDALEGNARIQEIAFERYGFRMGLSTAYENTSKFTTAQGEVEILGIPGEILSVVPSLRMEGYNKIVAALKKTAGQ